MESQELGGYGLPALNETPNPSDRLYKEILQRLGQHPRWMRQRLVLGTDLVKETRLARGTVTRTLTRLHNEGILEPLRGKGFRIIDVAPRSRATSVVSVTTFCREEHLEVVSVLDRTACQVYPLRDIPEEELAQSPSDESLREEIGNRLNITYGDEILVIRRARSFRPRGSTEEAKWAILETLFLVERKLRDLQQAVAKELQPLNAKNPLGNLSLHQWMQSHGVELERSEYSLTLGPLVARDAEAWTQLNPRPHHPADQPFIRLRAVTYGKRLGPLLYTREHLVPDLFDLAVTGFRFRPSRVLRSTDPQA